MGRKGFTLIELMGVIAIIAVLIALLTPALLSAVRTAREAGVQTELKGLETGMESFKFYFDRYPPSYIDFRLYSDAAGTTPSPAGDYLHPNTAPQLKTLFPRMDIPAFITDLKANPAQQRELDSAACLVFWLGGVVVDANGQPRGFGKNPHHPFLIDPQGENIGPFFEFRPERLYDANPQDPFDGYEGYLDQLPGQKNPYVYIPSRQYALREAELPVYRAAYSSFWFANRFQIVSPGYDGEYGESAVYDSKKQAFVEWSDPSDPASTKTYVTSGPGADNLTNFGSGPLVD